jgi:hypothetical protein
LDARIKAFTHPAANCAPMAVTYQFQGPTQSVLTSLTTESLLPYENRFSFPAARYIFPQVTRLRKKVSRSGQTRSRMLAQRTVPRALLRSKVTSNRSGTSKARFKLVYLAPVIRFPPFVPLFLEPPCHEATLNAAHL